MELFPITPGDGNLKTTQERIGMLADLGVCRVLIREKQLDSKALVRFAGAVHRFAEPRGVDVAVAEDVGVAKELGIGVHLSERSPSPLAIREQIGTLRLGVSLHLPVSRSPEDIRVCDYVFLAPLFSAPKAASGGERLGVERFLSWRNECSLPVYALGGIGLEHGAVLAAHDIHDVAAIRLFFAPERTPTQLLAFFRQLEDAR